MDSCRTYDLFKIKAGRFRKRYRSCNGFVRSNLFEFVCLRKHLLTFYHHGLYYKRWWASSSFGRLFLDPRMGTFDPVYFNSRWVDPNDVCSAIGTNRRRDYLATRETAYYIFFSAQNRIDKQTTYAKWSWKLSISI